jgi:two-component system, NarL family, sensor histidine kinase EvgS
VWRQLLCALLAVWALAAGAVDLTDAEKAWIVQHGPVKVLVLPTAEPYYEAGHEGRAPGGFAIEMLERVAQRAGLKLQYVLAPNVPEALMMLRQRQADMTPVMRLSRDRALAFSVPGSLLPVDPVVVSRREGTQAALQGDLSGQRLAVLAGSVNDEEFTVAYPAAQVERFTTLREAFKAVSDGRADLAPTTLQEAVYLIESQLLSNLLVRRLPNAGRAVLGPGVRLDLPELHSILAKAMDTITPAERADLARRWLPAGTATAFAGESAILTAAERSWVEKQGELRAGFDARFAPFTLAGTMGGMEGLGADILRAVAGKTGLRIVGQRGGAFADVYQAALTGNDVNVIVGMARTEQRSADFQFVGPFSSVATAMLMRRDDPRRWTEPDDMTAGSVGLLRQHFLLPRLRLRKPGLKLVEFDSQAEVLEALAARRVEAAIGNSAVIGRLMEDKFAGRLQITGVVRDGDSELYFGVPHRYPELARVLDRGLAAMSPSELAQLRQRWLFVQVQPGLRTADVLSWAAPLGSALLAGVVVLWLANRRLRVAHAATQGAHGAAVAATVARGRFLAYLAHELRGAVMGISSGASLLLRGDSPVPSEKLLGAMKSSADGLLSLMETTLSYERTMAAGIELQPADRELSDWWHETLAPLQLRAQDKGLQFESVPPPEGLHLRFDAQRLSQVVANLVGNAIKFTDQGHVVARARWDAVARQLSVEVEDEGPGIRADELNELFEPYAQGQAGRAAASGAGLGLAISRQIVEAMGGLVRAEPGRARGCLFRVEVPLAAVV